MNKGFISLAVVAIIGLVALLATGGGYTIYKINQLEEENQRITEQLVSERQEVAASSTEQIVSEPESSTQTPTEEVVLPNEEIVTKTPSVKTTPQPVPSAPTPSTPVTQPTAVSNTTESTQLSISNIEVTQKSDVAYVTWETSKKSNSRLVMDEEIFVSNQDNSTEHNVSIAGLTPSKTYSYEIVALAGSEKQSHFGKFSTPREYELSIESAPDAGDGCFYLVITDTSGLPLRSTDVTISGAYHTSNGIRVIVNNTYEATNFDGEIEFCDNLDEVTIIDTKTKEIYVENVSF